jgi:GTP cyclohydrolase I
MGNPTPPKLLKRDQEIRDALTAAEKKKNQLFDTIKSSQIVAEAPYHPGYEDAAIGPIAFDEDKDYKEANLADVIRFNMKRSNKRFWAGDNISEFVNGVNCKEILIDEATRAFEGVLDALLIDRENDPNSKGTARRLAKMYYNEIMAGRYEPAPDATAFPNDSEDRYEGMLVVRSELRSMCSHHHQPVSGVAYIGIIAANKLIGLSKYTRIAQWCARRGTLQEELCNDIAREISKATDTNDIGVYIQATHGCCENRGIMAHSSLTQTTVLKGAFKNDSGTKKEFMDNIKLQQEFAPR